MNKQELRKHVKALKSQFTATQLIDKSTAVIKNLESLVQFRRAKIIMAYWSMSDEVHTHEFVERWHKTKTILLPVIDGDNLLIKNFTGVENMVPDKRFGIPEPSGKPFTELDTIDLIVVPGVAFDRNKNRLGRGKAFYDRLLKSSTAPKAGICFDFQLFDTVPIDKYDIGMDIIISESEIVN